MTGKRAQRPLPPELAKQLRWPLRLTKATIGAERGWRAFWPLATLLMTAVAWARTIGFGPVTFAVLGISVLIALVWGIRRFSPPTDTAAEARLDQALPNAPIAALRDNAALEGTLASQVIWQAHQVRMAKEACHATAPMPDLRISDRDPFALRLMAGLACVMALAFGAGPGLSPGPQIGCENCAGSASWEGWIVPPAYTGQPSLYLNDQPSGPLAVPSGSQLTLRFYGLDQGRISLGGDLLEQELAEVMQVEISQNSDLSIAVSGRHTTPHWRFTAIGDIPPNIRTDGDLTREISGAFQQGFLAADDYGVSAGSAVIALALDRVDRRHGLAPSPDPRSEILLDLPRPYRGDPRQIQEVWRENQAEHPWAGLPVVVTLTARDEAGHIAAADPLFITLPARRFFTREGRALIEMRRDLLWARAAAPRVAQILRAISHRPDDLSLPDGSYLALRALIRDLEQAIALGLTEEDQDRLGAQLWEIALSIEETGLDSARDRLARAQDRLEQAIRDGATPEELAELMEELRRATQDYLDRLAQTPQDAPPPGQQGEMQELNSADLDAMMDRIEELMREGRMEEAMEMLDALGRMMENMQMAQGQGERANQQAREGLADTLQQQQGLSDEAFRELQEQGGQGNQAGNSDGNTGRDGGQGRGQTHSGEGGSEGRATGQNSDQGQGETGAEGGPLAQRQRHLQQQLETQRRALPGVGSEAGNAAREALGQAGRAMDQAADALESGDLSGALDRQAEAMEALREGLRRFDEATSQQAGRDGQPGQTGQQAGNPNARDPLGRATGQQSGRGLGEGGFVSEEDMRRRAQELTDELRKRSGETRRPEEERNYIERLLEQF